MRLALILLLTATTLSAKVTVETHDWQRACDGSVIEVAKDHGTVRGIRATATHDVVVIDWTILFLNGKPVSAEYRESSREKYARGDHAGEPTGELTLTTIK